MQNKAKLHLRKQKVVQTKTKPSPVIWAIVVWVILNIIIMALSLLGGDTADLNNYIEIALWTLSIAGVLSMRRWGAAFAIFTLSYTLAASVYNLIYFLSVNPNLWPNALRFINVAIIIYLFKTLFDGKLK
jgi:hypothetical protein